MLGVVVGAQHVDVVRDIVPDERPDGAVGGGIRRGVIVLGRLQQGGRHDVGVLLEHEQRADGLRRDVPVPQVYGLAEPGHGMAVGEVGDALQVAQRISGSTISEESSSH